MNTVVWKYPLDVQCDLRLPAGAEVLHVDSQTGGLALWALVDPHAPTELRTFHVRGTGHPLPRDCRLTHVGSLKTDEAGTFVFHVFEELP